MRISKLKKKGDRVEVILEDGNKLDLRLKISEKHGIYKGKDLSGSLSEEIKTDEEYSRVKDSAFRILSRRSHSVYELKTKLKMKEFSEKNIEKVLQELSELGYLDDNKFAEEFYHSRTRYKNDGLRKITGQLRQRGVESSIIDAIVRNNSEDSVHLENALKLAKIKLTSVNYKNTHDTAKLRAKLSLYLQNKGFSFDIIREVLKKSEL